jgi:hypothetical protein
LFKAVVSMSRARDVSAMSGDQLKLKAMVVEYAQRVMGGSTQGYRAGVEGRQMVLLSRAGAMRSHEEGFRGFTRMSAG